MATQHAMLKQIQGPTFAVKGDSGHWVVMDVAETAGGMDAGARPKELVLFALAGCTGSDVVNILRKRRVPLQDFEMHLSGEEAEGHPRAFTAIHMEYIFRGDGINPADVERAIELSTTTYCSVSAMLKASVRITHSYKIEPAAQLAGHVVTAE